MELFEQCVVKFCIQHIVMLWNLFMRSHINGALHVGKCKILICVIKLLSAKHEWFIGMFEWESNSKNPSSPPFYRPAGLPNGNIYCYQDSAFAVESLFVAKTESYAHNWPHKFAINGN